MLYFCVILYLSCMVLDALLLGMVCGKGECNLLRHGKTKDPGQWD